MGAGGEDAEVTDVELVLTEGDAAGRDVGEVERVIVGKVAMGMPSGSKSL